VREWLVLSLRGGTGFSAPAAFFVLRARAAQNHYDRVGLDTVIHRILVSVCCVALSAVHEWKIRSFGSE